MANRRKGAKQARVVELGLYTKVEETHSGEVHFLTGLQIPTDLRRVGQKVWIEYRTTGSSGLHYATERE